MQVLCMITSDDICDLECPCCHQRYTIYYSRSEKSEREAALEAVRTALLDHHTLSPLANAHPGDAFNVPAWSGPAHASAAALLSGAPIHRPAQSRAVTLTLLTSQQPQQRRVS